MSRAKGEDWLGGAPNGSTPSVVTTHIDNVVMSQWIGAGGTHAPAPTPAPASAQSPAPAAASLATSHGRRRRHPAAEDQPGRL